MLSSKDFKAPKGKFRVIGVDTFDLDGSDWIEGDFDTTELAVEHANKKGATMTKMHIYDDKGNHVHDAGTF